jgi:hypothetical protein
MKSTSECMLYLKIGYLYSSGEKKRCKKIGHFPRGSPVLFSKSGVWKSTGLSLALWAQVLGVFISGSWTVYWPQPWLLAGFCVVSCPRLIFSTQWLTFRRVMKFWEFDRKICKFEPQFFWKSDLFLRTEIDTPSSNYRRYNAMLGYWMIPRTMHFYVVYIRECSKKPWKSDWSEWYQNWQFIQWNHAFLVSIDRQETHLSICQKFKSRLSISFRRKMRCKKNVTFSKGVPVHFPFGGAWNVFENWNFFEKVYFWPLFL